MQARGISFFLVFILTITVYAQNAHHSIIHQTKQEKTEVQVLAHINALYEVKDFMKYHKKSEPLVMMDGDPDSTWNYYQVKVGLSDLGMMRTSYHFFVAPKTFKIYIWDEMDNSGEVSMHLISLQQWRHWRTDPRFNSFHTIRNNRLVILDKNGEAILNTSKKTFTK
jgi:hypothetical protein